MIGANLGLRIRGRWLGWRATSRSPREFQCNICGARNTSPYCDFGRETANCTGCGSTVRMRAMIHHVGEALHANALVLGEWPVDPGIRGVGLSDWDGYAVRLPHRVHYTNTYYHQEPFLDITNVPEDRKHTCDFIISTDVFEHVVPPVSKAFEGALALLKPGGTLVLSVPFDSNSAQTREHFPNLHKFEVRQVDEDYELVNTLPSGDVEVHRGLVFHGGPGDTLEMRMFGQQALAEALRSAGFTDIQFRSKPVPQFGIYWHYPWSVPVTARAPR